MVSISIMTCLTGILVAGMLQWVYCHSGRKARQKHILIWVYCSRNICCNLIIDLLNTCLCFPIQVNHASFVFFDYQVIVIKSIIYHSSWSKSYNALSYHDVWNMIPVEFQGVKIYIYRNRWISPKILHQLEPIILFRCYR